MTKTIVAFMSLALSANANNVTAKAADYDRVRVSFNLALQEVADSITTDCDKSLSFAVATQAGVSGAVLERASVDSTDHANLCGSGKDSLNSTCHVATTAETGLKAPCLTFNATTGTFVKAAASTLRRQLSATGTTVTFYHSFDVQDLKTNLDDGTANSIKSKLNTAILGAATPTTAVVPADVLSALIAKINTQLAAVSPSLGYTLTTNNTEVTGVSVGIVQAPTSDAFARAHVQASVVAFLTTALALISLYL